MKRQLKILGRKIAKEYGLSYKCDVKITLDLFMEQMQDRLLPYFKWKSIQKIGLRHSILMYKFYKKRMEKRILNILEIRLMDYYGDL